MSSSAVAAAAPAPKAAAALFACSKCYTRHPFEELSTGQQLCKVSYTSGGFGLLHGGDFYNGELRYIVP